MVSSPVDCLMSIAEANIYVADLLLDGLEKIFKS